MPARTPTEPEPRTGCASVCQQLVRIAANVLILGTFLHFLGLFVWEVPRDSMSESEGIHGNAAINSQTNGLQRLPPPARRLRPHHRTNSLSASRPSVAPADLCLAGLRPVSAVSGAQPVSGVLARKARGTVVLGDRRALAPDQARGAARHRRRISYALTSVADARPALSQHAHDRPHQARRKRA